MGPPSEMGAALSHTGDLKPMATFMIGGVARVIRPLNFHWMDNAWPALQQLMNEPPPPHPSEFGEGDDARAAYMQAVEAYNASQFGKSIDAILLVVAEGLDQERELTLIEAEERGEPIAVPPPAAPSKDRLRKVLRPDEMPLIHEPIFELLRESGMRVEGSGEPTPAGGSEGATADPSTETSTG